MTFHVLTPLVNEFRTEFGKKSGSATLPRHISHRVRIHFCDSFLIFRSAETPSIIAGLASTNPSQSITMSRTSRSKRSRRPPIAVVSIDDGSRRSSRQRSAGTSRRKRGELMDVAMGGFKSLTKGALMFLSAVVVYVVHEQQWNELVSLDNV